jgi:hypothetical protein
MTSSKADLQMWQGVIPELIAHRAPELEVGVANADPEVLLNLVRVVSAVSDDAARSLRDSVTAARSAGVSWDAIGSVLGTSRQAAQQRFAEPKGATSRTADSTRRAIIGVNLFTELDILESEGLDRWLLTNAVAGSLEFERTAEPVAYRRLRSLRKQTIIDHQRAEGWSYCCSYAVFHYFSQPVSPNQPEKGATT